MTMRGQLLRQRPAREATARDPVLRRRGRALDEGARLRKVEGAHPEWTKRRGDKDVDFVRERFKIVHELP